LFFLLGIDLFEFIKDNDCKLLDHLDKYFKYSHTSSLVYDNGWDILSHAKNGDMLGEHILVLPEPFSPVSKTPVDDSPS
jgi:hypothetical protein